MAKKKNKFGKLLAFTTTAAAIGGTCYIFRDKIKQSPIYKTACSKFSDIFGNVSDKFCSDDTEDFFFDDEDDDFKDVFSENTEHGREYTSITINAKEEAKKDGESGTENTANPSDSEASEDTADSSDNETSKDTADSSDNENSKDTKDSSDNKTSKDNENSSEKKAGTEDSSAPGKKTAAAEAAPDEELIEIFPKNSISSIPVSGTADHTNSASGKNDSSDK